MRRLGFREPAPGPNLRRSFGEGLLAYGWWAFRSGGRWAHWAGILGAALGVVLGIVIVFQANRDAVHSVGEKWLAAGLSAAVLGAFLGAFAALLGGLIGWALGKVRGE